MTEQQEQPDVSADEVRTRPFADVLRDLNRQRTHNEMSLALQDLVAAVLDTGKAGTLTLVLKVSSAKSHDMVVIEDDVRLKKPQARAASMFFLDEHMNVMRDNPNQDTLPGLIAAVPSDSTNQPLRKAD